MLLLLLLLLLLLCGPRIFFIEKLCHELYSKPYVFLINGKRNFKIIHSVIVEVPRFVVGTANNFLFEKECQIPF